MRTLSCLLVLFTLCFEAAPAFAQVPYTFKYDQFNADISTAAGEVSGKPLATQAGFVYGEAFGQVYHPDPGMYPVSFNGVDIIMAAPPNGGIGEADALIEFWFHDSATADPGKAAPDFVLSTKDVFNPETSDFGMPIKGNTAIGFDFDPEDPEGHPPALTSGSFTVMIRFQEQAADLQQEWGTFQCMVVPGVSCGCQQVGTLNDQASTPNANVMHILGGGCSGQATTWVFANAIGVTGDFVLRVRANVAQGPCTPSCSGKTCGNDGCGGSCGTCPPDQTCQAGQCKPGGCQPQCDGKECGDDGCQGDCGPCPQGKQCVEDKCEDIGPCQPQCDGKECGDDGCEGVCGVCDEGFACVKGKCEDTGACKPACDDKECGDDGCKGVCGLCGDDETCQEGKCVGTGPGKITITDVSPKFGFNDVETAISVIGDGFAPGATVKLGGTDLYAVQVPSGQLITAKVPAGLSPGFYTLIVMNSDQSTASLANAFEVKTQQGGDGDESSGCTAGPVPRTAGLGLLALAAACLLARRRRSA